jgi:hypothetical protein
LNAELARLQRTLELPDPNQGVAYEPVAVEVAESLKIAFSTVRLARTDQAERVFVSMLLETEPDLRTYHDEPMVFPVFGRGRVLYALVGEGINRENISEAAQYLVGACSCLVKAENPGLDLLMLADWDAVPDVSVDVAPPEVVALPDLSAVNTGPTDGPGQDQVPSHGRPAVLLANAALATAGVALLSGVLFLWLRKRRVD